jgi:uncharacterized protein
MTVEREHIVTSVVAMANQHVTSRVRLQKAFYILDQLGLNSGFDYEYYHYGPYSRDLDLATSDAKAFDLLEETFGYRQSDGARYSIFTSKEAARAEVFTALAGERVAALMKTFIDTNVTVLELAATIDWLWRFEKIKDWKSEIKKRKPVKAKDERLSKAVDLLTSLKLPPPAIA